MFDTHTGLGRECRHDIAHFIPILWVVDHAVQLWFHVFLVLQRIFTHVKFSFQFTADSVVFWFKFVLLVFEEFELLRNDQVFLHDLFRIVHWIFHLEIQAFEFKWLHFDFRAQFIHLALEFSSDQPLLWHDFVVLSLLGPDAAFVLVIRIF